MSEIICHAPGDTCLGCKAYRSGEGVCEFATEPHPQAALLEKLAMIKEAVERNPDEWWEEICIGDSCIIADSANDFWRYWQNGIREGWFRLKPQRVKVEGWVDSILIEAAKDLIESAEKGRFDGTIITPTPLEQQGRVVAQALLDCVKTCKDNSI